MDYEIQMKLQRHLGSGERLRWAGKPLQGIRLRDGDGFAIPFSVVWCSFAAFWVYSVSQADAPPFMLLFGLFFIAAGLYSVFGRFIWDAMRRAKTYYGITDTRVLILSELPSEKLQSVIVRNLPEVSFREYGDGSGTIWLGTREGMHFGAFNRGAGWGSHRAPTPQLFRIEHAEEIHRMIQNMHRQQT